ncbi:hypothetical protein B0T09DRAFT_352370, partial [Sordaria sp. MPI-SDFR-AT-0083]
TAAYWSIVWLLCAVNSSAMTRDCDNLAKSFSVGPDYSFSSFLLPMLAKARQWQLSKAYFTASERRNLFSSLSLDWRRPAKSSLMSACHINVSSVNDQMQL